MDNNLRSTIPTELVSKLRNFQHLWLSSNLLNGTLPGDLSLSIQSIELSTNLLTGTLSSAGGDSLFNANFLGVMRNRPWQGLKSLKWLRIGFHWFTGTIAVDFLSCAYVERGDSVEWQSIIGYAAFGPWHTIVAGDFMDSTQQANRNFADGISLTHSNNLCWQL